MVKIFLAEPEYFPEESVKILREAGEVESGKFAWKELVEKMQDADVLVIRVGTKVDSSLLEKSKRLKIIATATAGVDHIDVREAEKRGIKIISLDGANTRPTAEYTMAMILCLARKIPWAFEHLKKGGWERHRFFGAGLEGKTLGVIGLGKIGMKVAAYGKAFGMKVVAYDPYIKKEFFLEAEIEPVTLDGLLEMADIVTVHSLLTKETENMIGEREFGRMKAGAFLVNAARGKILDERALLDSLKNKKLGGAALDVYSKEPVEIGSELVKYAMENENLLLTPHIAASTKESVNEAAVYIALKVKEAVGNL